MAERLNQPYRELFVAPDNPVLRKRTRFLTLEEIQSDYVQAEIDRMLAVMHNQEDPSNREPMRAPIVGLAHPQIATKGKPLPIITVAMNVLERVTGETKTEPQIFINPNISPTSSEIAFGRESCFSVDPRVGGFVAAPVSARIEAQDRYGNAIPPFECQTPFQTRIVTHEINHLHGILFVDGIIHPRYLLLRDRDPELFMQLIHDKRFEPDNHSYPHTGTYNQLRRLIQGKPYDTVVARTLHQVFQ